MRSIQAMEEKYLIPSLELVETVFSQYNCPEDGRLTRLLVEEIRGKETYLPELELIMVDEAKEVIGYCMFSRFHLEGKYGNELLLLTPVAVKTQLQRQHISKELIEYGFKKRPRWDTRRSSWREIPKTTAPVACHFRRLRHYCPCFCEIARAGMPDGQRAGTRHIGEDQRRGFV